MHFFGTPGIIIILEIFLLFDSQFEHNLLFIDQLRIHVECCTEEESIPFKICHHLIEHGFIVSSDIHSSEVQVELLRQAAGVILVADSR